MNYGWWLDGNQFLTELNSKTALELWPCSNVSRSVHLRCGMSRNRQFINQTGFLPYLLEREQLDFPNPILPAHLTQFLMFAKS